MIMRPVDRDVANARNCADDRRSKTGQARGTCSESSDRSVWHLAWHPCTRSHLGQPQSATRPALPETARAACTETVVGEHRCRRGGQCVHCGDEGIPPYDGCFCRYVNFVSTCGIESSQYLRQPHLNREVIRIPDPGMSNFG